MPITISPQGPGDRLANALALALQGSGRDINILNALAGPGRQQAIEALTAGGSAATPAYSPVVEALSGPVPRTPVASPADMAVNPIRTTTLPPQQSGTRPGRRSASSGAPIEVELPDGTIVEFPAGTSETVMRDALRREYGNGLTGGASRASFADLMKATRRAHEAGDGEAARRLAALAVQAREREQAAAIHNASQRLPREDSGQDAQDDNWWASAPLADQPSPMPQQSVEPRAPQIVGDTIVPPTPGPDGYQPTQERQINPKSVIAQGSDIAGDVLGSGLAGLSRGVTGIADLPGLAASGGSTLGLMLLQRAGLIQPEQATQARGLLDAVMQRHTGTGTTARDAVADLTGGASEFRGETTAGKYAGTAGEFLPGAMAAGGATVGNALRYGLLPAFASETAGQLTEGTAAEPWARAGAAVLAAPAASLAEAGVRRAVSPYGGADQGRLALAQVLDDAGVPVSAGQRVGSEALRRREGMTAAGQALNETQREALTRAALRTTGTDASRATPEVLADTARRIGSVFDGVARGVDVTPDPATVNAVAQANQTYQQLAPKASQAPIIGEIVKRMTGAFRNGQTIPASTVNSWRANLSKLTTSSDGATRSAAVDAMNALDDALASTLTNMGRADDVARLATAREQWRNFLAIQKAATSAGEVAAAGILSPSALRSAVVQQGRASYAQGNRGELGDLARAGEGILRPLPNSGTAQNIQAMGLPGLGWASAGAGLGSLAGGPTGGALGAATGTVMPGLLGMLRMSGPMQNWLANQTVGRGGSILPTNALAPVLSALTEVNR